MTFDPVTFGQQDRSGLIFGLRRGPLVALAVTAAGLLLGLRAGGLAGFALALVTLSPLGASALIKVKGRAGIEWIPVALAWAWRAQADQRRYLRSFGARRATDLVLPGRAARLRLRVCGEGVAVVEDPAEGTFSVSARVAHLPFLLTEAGVKERRVAAWGDVLAQLASVRGLSRLQITERALPDRPDALRAYFAAHGVPGSAAAGDYQALVEEAGPAAEVHEGYLVLSFSRRQLRRDLRRGNGLDALVTQRMAWADAALSGAELTPTWLGPRELSGVLRSAYDTGSSAGRCSPSWAGPEGMEERWDHLRANGSFHVAYAVAEWPRLPVGIDFLAPLVLSSGLRRSITLSMEPVPTGRAEREIRAAKAEHHSGEETKARLGVVSSKRDDAAYEDVARREADLVAGHGELRYAAVVVVTASGEEALEEACVGIESLARSAQLELHRLYGQQHQGFSCGALPLGLPFFGTGRIR